MDDQTLRLVLIGGDSAAWLEVSEALAGRSSQIFVPRDVSPSALGEIGSEIDVIIVITSPSEPDPCAPLRMIRAIGLQRRTLVVADADDQRTAAEALDIGVAGYVRRSAATEHLATSIVHVARGGVFYDAPAAAVVHGRSIDPLIGGGHMGAARALAAALELKDTYTGGHAERVTALAIRLARVALLPDALPSESLEAAFLLHDVGKIGIPESILNKPSGLTDTERRVLNTHPILGERIIAPLGFPEVVSQVVRHHHERWDGSGYPDGLTGTEIPAAARIFSIADVIDAMTSIRPYRRPVSFETAVREVIRYSGSHFDPQLAALAQEIFLDTAVPVPESPARVDDL
jgi:HD-GYP domain-containing protein (c-di-GMP phosphodiesterase class II)